MMGSQFKCSTKTAFVLCFCIIYALGLYALLIGINFGHHWDEGVQFSLVSRSLRDGLLLPHWYLYPSMVYWISMASVSDHAVSMLVSFFEQISREPGETSNVLNNTPIPFSYGTFVLRARALAILTSSLGAVWLFLALDRSPFVRNQFTAVVAAMFFLFSWEFGYHARWLAPDAIMAQFVALFLFSLLKADAAVEPDPWLYLAAISVGLATATKYTGGGLLFGLWLYIVAGASDGYYRTVMRILVASAITTATFLIITPGAVLEPAQFARDVFF